MWNKNRFTPPTRTRQPMKEFYYLNHSNVPQGPYNLAELGELMADGCINPTTLVACKGGANWEALGTVLSREHMAPTATQNNPLATPCSTCGYALANCLADGSTPAFCPCCGAAVSKKPPHTARGIWGHFLHAMQQFGRMKGRATRAEFWSFQLVNLLVCFVLYVVSIVAVVRIIGTEALAEAQQQQQVQALYEAQMAGENAEALSLVIYGVLLALGSWWLLTLVPQVSLLVRRLHDAGWSGMWALPFFVLAAAAGLLVLGALLGFTTPEQASTLQLVQQGLAACGLFLLVLTLQDSQRGNNSHGPSPKYPHAR